MLRALEPSIPEILRELPPGTEYMASESAPGMILATRRDSSNFDNDDERRAWLVSSINGFVNALRPRLKQLAAMS